MRSWQRYAICIVLGVVVGVAFAVYQVRSGLADGTITNGAWTTGKSFGTADADALTRARVALGGLLALPAKEAMYFTANVDDEGEPLEWALHLRRQWRQAGWTVVERDPV